MESQNEKFKNIISNILGVKVQVKGISSGFTQDEKRKQYLEDAIYTLKEYFKNQMYLSRTSNLDLMNLNGDLYNVVDILLEISIPSIKARNLINWWIYERDMGFLENNSGKYLKAYYKNGDEVDLTTVENLMKLIERIETEEDFDFDMEIIKYDTPTEEEDGE